MTYALNVYCGEWQMATVTYDPIEDRFGLDYHPKWLSDSKSFPMSPALALTTPGQAYPPGAVRRFVENLLPEGRALDIASSTYQISKNNVFALIRALGRETAGALSFRPAEDERNATRDGPAPREVTREELRARIAERRQVPFEVWDNKVRLSIPGFQDKLPLYLDAQGRMFLVEPPLASTHIVKPEPLDERMQRLVVNEHYCMTLAARMHLPVAPVQIFRLPEPLLVITRFDRSIQEGSVLRHHIVDACQALDLSVSAKYERNFGTSEDVRHIRDGVSFERLFAACDSAANKALVKQSLLRWALYQFVIGNSDAHGKNVSFFMRPEGLEAAPWYDLVSTVQYEHLVHDLAMAFGDEFSLREVSAFALADFAKRCNISRQLLAREMRRMAKGVTALARSQAADPVYLESERPDVQRIAAFCMEQARHLERLAPLALSVDDEPL